MEMINWFRRTKKEPGWLVLASDEHRLSYVHGRYATSGKSFVDFYGSTPPVEPGRSSLERVAKDLNVHDFQCATLLHPGEYQLVLVEAPTVPQAELKSAIRWRIKDMLDYHVDDAMVDVLDIPPESSVAGRGHSMYAVAARNEVIQERIKAYEEAQVPLTVIDIPETAQRNICALYEPEGRGAALLYLYQDFGLLTVTFRGELYLARRIDIGLHQILGRPQDGRAELLGRIALELQRTFDHFERQFHYVTIAKVVLAPEAEDCGLQGYLKAELDVPVERVDLCAHVNFNGREDPDAAAQWQFFHLVGASMRHEAKVL